LKSIVNKPEGMASEERGGNGREKDGSGGKYCFMLSGGIDATAKPLQF